MTDDFDRARKFPSEEEASDYIKKLAKPLSSHARVMKYSD